MLAKGTPWFIYVPPALALVLALAMVAGWAPLAWWWVALLGLLAAATAFGAFFFRDPERSTGEGLVAPVHGRVLAVAEEGGWTRVSTFMGPFDVHVVRAPLDGTVRSMARGGAGFRRADSAVAGHNVQLDIALDGAGAEGGSPHRVVMVSGWFARRIVPYVAVGDPVARGSRIGLIRFGSRVDVLVPTDGFRITASPGRRVRGGESSLGVVAHARD
jgi:phosphatidylserine decarboxylase